MTDPIIAAARFLSDQMRWIRHATDEQGQPYAVAVFAEIAACARRIRGVVDGPSEKRYLGPCGALKHRCEGLLPDDWPEADCGNHVPHEAHDREPCEGDMRARIGPDGRIAETGRCDTCGATVDTAERTAWLDSEVRNYAYRASEIQDAYGVNANLIRQWATPGRDLIQVHGHDREGRALYLLSQVLDVARGMAARRAERQAEKARRTAARAAESESVA